MRRDELVLGNRRLASYFASRYLTWGKHDLEFDDLAQEGSIGLILAAEHYDPARHGTRFSAYAHYWIRSRIRMAIANTGEAIRLPVHLHDRRQDGQWRSRFAGSDFLEASPPSTHASQVEQLIRDEMHDRLNTRLALLTPSQRALLRWYADELAAAGEGRQLSDRFLKRRKSAEHLVSRLRAELNQEGSEE